MIIKPEFSEMPPKPFLMQVLDKNSRVYVHLWEKKNENNLFFISWDELRKQYNTNAFKTSLRKLCDLGLLSFDETFDGFAVELVGWEEVE